MVGCRRKGAFSTAPHGARGTVNALRAILRQQGVRVPPGHPETLLARLDRLGLDASLTALLAPLVQVLRTLATEIRTADRWATTTAEHDETTARLMTVPGVGPITALTDAATLDTPNRFAGDAARASAYVGLVPREYSSGERQHRGRITKTGPPTVRSLLVQAAWSVWVRPGAAGAALHAWVTQLAASQDAPLAGHMQLRIATRGAIGGSSSW